MPPVAAAIGAAIATATAGTAIAVSAAAATTVVGGMMVGAAVGAATAAISGKNVLKGALMGGALGGVASGLSVAMNGPASWATAATGAEESLTSSVIASGGMESAASQIGNAAAAEGGGLAENVFASGYADSITGISQPATQTAAQSFIPASSEGILDKFNKLGPGAQFGLVQAGGNALAGAFEPSEEEKAAALASGRIAVDTNAQNLINANKITLGGVKDAGFDKTAEFTDVPLWRQIAENPEWKKPLLRRTT